MACNASITPNKDNETTKEVDGLPVNPFRSLLVHFGMLLGVDDFETIDSYHRGKMRLHNAWLHRQGTIWGLKVTYDHETEQIKVSPGLAVDGLGRELYLETPLCLDIPAWYAEHKEDPKVLAAIAATKEENGDGENKDKTIRFAAHVAIRFKACLGRQVPALTEPCDNSGAGTAYSRIFETVEVQLKAGKAPEWRTPAGSLPYHRLRLLFGLEEAIEIEENGKKTITPADQDVLEEIEEITKKSPEEQPAAWLDAFRHFSALDQMDLSLAESEEGEPLPLFSAQDPILVPLADLPKITLNPVATGWDLVLDDDEEVDIDNTIRPVHLPTSTIQELLCGPGCSCSGNTTSHPAPIVEPVYTYGPGIVGNPDIDNDTITFKVDSPLLEASVNAQGISVTCLTDEDWQEVEIESVECDESGKEVTVKLSNEPKGTPVRLILKGTGKFPILSATGLLPLSGKQGQPLESMENGNDFVYMFKES
ncbi:MAG: hypothetical protein QTN59_04220 [Candidatus Electrothrix communis]|nr:MAG: hypothetical protein QTN59_04220 [Candidatus Electrothrix communis]